MFFSFNCIDETISSYFNLLKISSCTNFGKYLGYPIFNKKLANYDFQFIIYNIQVRIAGWKTKMINIAGRIVLVELTLNNIHSYVMKYIKLPYKITSVSIKSK